MSENAKRSKANARVRKHIPGGGEVLDLLNLVHKIHERQHPSTEAGKIATTILDRLDDIAQIMREKALEIHEATREKTK
jgi:hypothetical protein